MSSGQQKTRRKAAKLALELPTVEGHPNRVPFDGVLTLVDVASDMPPTGARGHRVILSRAAAEVALPSLLGMGVDFKTGWEGHDARQKCGIITHAEIQGARVVVAGFIFGKDFPEIEQVSRELDLGMSYELANAHVANMKAQIWTLTRVTFMGAAIMRRDSAAYKTTQFRLLAAKKVPAKRVETGTR